MRRGNLDLRPIHFGPNRDKPGEVQLNVPHGPSGVARAGADRRSDAAGAREVGSGALRLQGSFCPNP